MVRRTRRASLRTCSRLRPLLNEHYVRHVRSGIEQVVWVMGAALFASRSTFENIGGWDPGFFIYYEDSDICLRALQQGVLTFVDGDVRFVHRLGARDRQRQVTERVEARVPLRCPVLRQASSLPDPDGAPQPRPQDGRGCRGAVSVDVSPRISRSRLPSYEQGAGLPWRVLATVTTLALTFPFALDAQYALEQGAFDYGQHVEWQSRLLIFVPLAALALTVAAPTFRIAIAVYWAWSFVFLGLAPAIQLARQSFPWNGTSSGGD